MRTDDPFIQSVKDARSRIASLAVVTDRQRKAAPNVIAQFYGAGQYAALIDTKKILTDLLRSYGINPEEETNG